MGKKKKRFAPLALTIITIWLAVFSIAQMVIFAFTGMEQTALIESTFTVIGLECGGLLLKRIVDKIFEKKHEEDWP